MYLARVKDKDDQTTFIRPDQYDPATHGGHLLCGDKDCDTPMTFRRCEGKTHGESYTRTSHFVTMPSRKHREGCTIWTAPEEDSNERETFISALKNGMDVVINLNLKLGSGLQVEFNNAKEFPHAGTAYARLARDHSKDYATRSVRSLSEFLEAVHQIEEIGGKEALDRVKVTYFQMVQPLKSVMVMHDEETLRTLARTMSHEQECVAKLPDKVVGFPRLLHFIPTKNARNRKGGLVGNTLTLHESDTAKIIFLQSVDTHGTTLKDRVLDECEVYVLACPILRVPDIRQRTKEYKEGKTDAIFVFMNWNVVNEAQFASVPLADRKFKPRTPRQGVGPQSPLPL